MNLSNKISLSNNIFIYEDFLTHEESQSLISILDKQADIGKINWMPISFYESYSSVLPHDNDPELEEFGLPSNFMSEINKKIVEAVADIDSLSTDRIFEIGYHAQKWEKGAYARLHSDNTDEHGNTGPFERSKYAGFIYLNDDFEGGVLRFPKNNLEIKPKVGMLAVFDGGYNNMHEVSTVTNGVRYTIGSFWDNKSEADYPQEVKDAWAKEMKDIRDKQKEEKEQWQSLLKDGYKIDVNGQKYKVKE